MVVAECGSNNSISRKSLSFGADSANKTAKPIAVKTMATCGMRIWPRIFALVYLLIAGGAAWRTVAHTSAATRCFDQICDKESLQNEGAQFVARYLKAEHPILRPFVWPSIKQALDLPSLQQASHELGTEIPHLAQLAERESALAAWWSWLLLSVSLLYIVAAIALPDSHQTRNVLFALAGVSTILFAVGMAAPAMVILTIPSVAVESGKLAFVLQHEVRSILSVIAGLFSAGHWMIGGLLAAFSIVTPLIKTSLTVIATTTASLSLHARITRFLHAIGKWAMADVFVAAVLLAYFALNSQEATKAIPCPGLYYFAGYCLLSMVTTLLLTKLDFLEGKKSPDPGKKPGVAVIGGLFGGALLLIVAGGIYLFEEHPVPAVPMELNDSQVSLPAHHWQQIPLSVPHAGILSIELRVTRGNAVNVALIRADQLSSVAQTNGGIDAGNLQRAGLPAFKAVQVKDYNRARQVDKGDFLIVLQDPARGILSASKSDIEIHAELSNDAGRWLR